MITQLPWTQRTFNFDFHHGLFPNILERLYGTPARIEELISGVGDDRLSQRINGKWSVKEHIGHLHDLEELHYGRIDDFLNHEPVLRAADMSNKKTNNADHNYKSIEELIEQFRVSRKEFTDRLSTLDEHQIIITSIHPRLNQLMRIVDMMYFTAEHDDHHLAIIRDILGI
jgi:uncharacterized damage-inducible protein DinB